MLCIFIFISEINYLPTYLPPKIVNKNLKNMAVIQSMTSQTIRQYLTFNM